MVLNHLVTSGVGLARAGALGNRGCRLHTYSPAAALHAAAAILTYCTVKVFFRYQPYGYETPSLFLLKDLFYSQDLGPCFSFNNRFREHSPSLSY